MNNLHLPLVTMLCLLSIPATSNRAWSFTLPHFGIRIDATDYQECLAKGTDLVRSGKSPAQVHDYCERRYAAYAYCKPRKLSPAEMRNVSLGFGRHVGGYYEGRAARDMDVRITNNSQLLLTEVTFIESDSGNPKNRTTGQANLDHLRNGQNYPVGTNTDPAFPGVIFDQLEIISVKGCLP